MPQPPVSPPPGSGRTPAGNVYYKQDRGARSRHATPVTSVPAGDPAGRGSLQNNPIRMEMLKNVRRFIIVTLAMCVITYLCVKALFYIWQIKDNAMMNSASPPAPAADESSSAKGAGENTSRADTDAVRNAVVLAKRAKALAQEGKNQEALQTYREAVAAWPYLTDVWAQMGSLYLKLHDYSQAQVTLAKAIDNEDVSAEILNDLGVAYLMPGQHSRAMEFFMRAEAADPTFSPTYYNRALCHLAMNNRAASREDFVRFLQSNPGDPRALREVAFLDAVSSQYESALDSLQKAIVQAPEWPLLYFDAAVASSLLDRPDDTFRYLKQAEALSSPATVYRVFQGNAFKAIRKSPAGIEYENGLVERARETRVPAPVAEPVVDPSVPLSSVTPASSRTP